VAIGLSFRARKTVYPRLNCGHALPAPDIILHRSVRIIARTPSDPQAKPRRPGAKTARKSPEPVLAEAAKAPGTPRKKAAAAGPRRRKPAEREPALPEVLDQHLALIQDSLADDKAEDIVVLDLTGRATFADRMVIATGLADRQIAAMAQHLERKLNEVGVKRVLIEGANGSDWVLLDTGDIVVHLFKPDSRVLYGLERMWGAELDAADEADAEPDAP